VFLSLEPDHQVAFTVVPGFSIDKTVIQCQVYLSSFQTKRHIELEEGKKWLCQDAAILFYFCPFMASLKKENAWGVLLLFLLSKNIPPQFC
jgi:hypothetical protein